MIVPPFFGLYLPSKEQDVYRLRHSYLSHDVLTYPSANNIIHISYLGPEILSYNIVSDPIQISLLSEDVLAYTIPDRQLNVSACSIDVLCYDPPPLAPAAPSFISLLEEGDSFVSLNWSIPYNNRSPLIDYTIQYKPITGSIWSIVNDGINLNTGLVVDGLINYTTYEFRVAAINAIGTGSFITSDAITPSGGDDSYCNLKLLIQPDSSDISAIMDLSCNSGITNHIGIQSDDINYVYGGRSLFFDGQEDFAPDPNQFPYFTTSNHFKITRNTGINPNTFWSLSNDFTIELFIKPTTTTAESKQTLLSAYTQWDSIGTFNNGRWKLYREQNSIYFFAQIDYLSEDRGYINESLNISADNINFSTINFTHIALCRSLGDIRLYINGTQILKQRYAEQIPIYSNYLIVGADHTNQNYNYDIYGINRVYTFDPFVGNIDDILISQSAKYRRNFTPARYDKTIDCRECREPGPVTNLTVTVVDGV